MPPTLLQRITTAIQNTRRQNQPGVTIADFQSDRFVRLLDLTADERLVFNRLVARLQQIDNFNFPQLNVVLNNVLSGGSDNILNVLSTLVSSQERLGRSDGFISASEIEALARLAGNGNEIEASDLDRFDILLQQAQQVQLPPQIGGPQPPPQVGPTEFIPRTQVPTAIAQYVPTQGPRLGVSTHRFPNGEVNLGGTGSSGVISLGDNRYARMFWGRDNRLHMLVYTTRPDSANLQGPPLVNDYVREYVIPFQYLQAMARRRGMHLTMSQYDRDRNRPPLTELSNEHCLERLILPHLLRDAPGGPINLARLSSSGLLPIDGINSGVSFREGGLSTLNAMIYTPLVQAQQNPEYADDNPGPTLPRIQQDNIVHPLQARVDEVADDALLQMFNNYYDTNTVQGRNRLNHVNLNRDDENNTITNSSGLFRLSNNRVARLIRVQEADGSIHYRLLVRARHQDSVGYQFTLEEYRIPQVLLQDVSRQYGENINFNNFNSVYNFVGRRLRCFDQAEAATAHLHTQRGYIQLTDLISNPRTINGQTYNAQCRTSSRLTGVTNEGMPNENRHFITYFRNPNNEDNGNAFQNAINSMVPSSRESVGLEWSNSAFGLGTYYGLNGIHDTDDWGALNIQNLSTVPSLVEEFGRIMPQICQSRNSPTVRGLPQYQGQNFGTNSIRRLTQFSIVSPRTGRTENRQVFLWNRGGTTGYFVLSWEGNNPSSYRAAFIPANQVQIAGFNYTNPEQLRLEAAESDGDLYRARINLEVLNFRLFFGSSEFIENHLDQRTGIESFNGFMDTQRRWLEDTNRFLQQQQQQQQQ